MLQLLPLAGPAQFHLVPHSSFDPSLQFWKKDKVEEEPPKAVGSVGAFDNGKNDLIAPTIQYAAYTSILILFIYKLCDAIVTTTLGSKALALVTGALIWDNMIISIGSFFFKNSYCYQSKEGQDFGDFVYSKIHSTCSRSSTPMHHSR